MRLVDAAFVIAASLTAAIGTSAAASGSSPDLRVQAICGIVDKAAIANRLPPALLARVLWQESRFRNEATSRVGAEGVAQFMLQTAAELGLTDPRDPELAITAAAKLLTELTARFGNVGLAAAAYNAGANRIVKWLNAATDLPSETRLYVRAVTDRDIDDWIKPAAPRAAVASTPCFETIRLVAAAGAGGAAAARLPLAAWQVRLDQSLARLTLAMRRAQHAETDGAVWALCARLRARGAHCTVYAP